MDSDQTTQNEMYFSKIHKIGNFTYILHLKLEQNILKITVNDQTNAP